MSEGRLRDRVPVEALDDERLSRIERGVISALPARPGARAPWRGAAPWLAAAVAAAVAAVALVGLWRRGDGGAPLAARPTTIVAGAAGATIDLGDAVIVAGGGATFSVARPDGGVDIALTRGKLELDVAPRRGRPPLVVHADDVAVVVVGTRFAVERGDEVAVTVTEGLVRVERGGTTDMVAAGQAWSQRARVAAGPAAPAAPAEGDVPVVATTAGDGAATGAEIDVDVLRDRAAAVPPAPTRDGGEGEARDRRGDARERRRDPAATDDRRPSGRQAGAAVELDPLAELAADLAAQPLAAAGAGASGELYGKALAEFRRGRAREAGRLLDAYRVRFPSGSEREAVAWLRVRIACAGGIADGCRKAANAYLGAHDDGGRRAGIARRITATR